MKSPSVGRWRIVEMEQWDRDFLDLVARKSAQEMSDIPIGK